MDSASRRLSSPNTRAPAGGMQEVEQLADGGRLAGAVGAEEPEHLASLDRHGHVLDPALFAVALGQAFELDNGDHANDRRDRDRRGHPRFPAGAGGVLPMAARRTAARLASEPS